MKIQSNKSKKAFTLIELLIVITMIATVVATVIFCLILLMGNFWFTPEGVLKQAQATIVPTATDVATYRRNVFKKSEVTVKLKDGTTKTILVDADIFWNYDLSEKPQK